MLPAGDSPRYCPPGGSCALHPLAYESRFMTQRVTGLHVFGPEGADVEQELKLVSQMRPHHLRPVRGDRERHLAVDEYCDRVPQRVLIRERPRQQVRGRANLQHDAGLAEEAHRLLVLGGEDAMADAVGAQVPNDLSDLGDAVGAALLAHVDRDAETGGARLFDERRELAVGVAAAVRTGAGDVDPDDSTPPVARRLLDDDLVLGPREGAIHHEDEPRAHTRVLEARQVEPAHGGHDDVVEVALAAAVSLHRIEAELERRDVLAAVRAADRAVDGLLDRDRARLDELRPVVDLVEGGEALDAPWIDRDEVDELPVVLD